MKLKDYLYYSEDKVKLYNADSSEILKKLPDNYVDLIVTDPPYALKFMGKDWDKTLPSIEIWRECLRVLKPGAFAFIMSAPRQDVLSRMIYNLQEAGFETGFSSIYWSYACLSEDTEILTKEGFKGIDELTKEDIIGSLNLQKDRIEYKQVLDKYIYNINDELVNIKTKNTDQLITKNHKVLLKSRTHSRYNYENYRYKEAIELSLGRNYPYYKLPLARKFIGRKSIGANFAELLGWIITEGHYQKDCNSINIYQSSTNNKNVDRIRYLLKKLRIPHSEYKRKRYYKNKVYTEHQFYIKGNWNTKIKKYLPNKKPINKLLFLKQEELQALFNGLIGGDGSVRKGKINPESYAFWQKDRDVMEFVQILATHLGYRTSINEKKNCLNIGWRSDTEIQERNKHIKMIKYKGRIWSILTKYGNYVARRNGYVFITGNSGFPKASNTSKLIDKQECKKELTKKLGRKPTKKEFEKAWGKYREVIGEKIRGDVEEAKNRGTTFTQAEANKNNKAIFGYGIEKITEPKSPQAKELDGSYGGFQPKPAVEIIIVAMKPLSEKTYVDQALKNDKGVTWLDNCRIPTNPEVDDMLRKVDRKKRESKTWEEGSGFKNEKNQLTGVRKEGRFPANLIVSNDVLNDGKISKSSKSKANYEKSKPANIPVGCAGGTIKSGVHFGDFGSYSRYFDLDAWWQERVKKLPPEVQKVFPYLIVPKASKSEKNKGCENLPLGEAPGTGRSKPAEGRKSALGAPRKNNHPTVKPIKLMSYLITLGSREGDIVLDPFTGSGTTLIASKLLNRKGIGIEMSSEYCNIAKARIKGTSK